MSFELESSSSSSDMDNVPLQRRIEAPSNSDDDDDIDNNSDHDIDETLLQSIRSALHFAVGTICQQEDSLTAGENIINDAPSFSTSSSAMASLTDLAFHYATTILANDAVAFSAHAGRKAVKAEDVMLLARRDKGGIGAELKQKRREMMARGVGKEKTARGGGSNAQKGKGRSAAGKRSLSPSGTGKRGWNTMPNDRVGTMSTGTVGKSNKNTQRNNGRRKPKAAALDSSSSDEEDALLLMQQRVKDMERTKSGNSHDEQEDGTTDLNDFIVDDNGYFNRDRGSDSEVEFPFGSDKKKKGTTPCKSKKKESGAALFNSSKKAAPKQRRGKDIFRDLSDSDSSASIGRAKSDRADGSTEAMVIDLDSD
eukprot:CCRYP_002806-RA/>CCRYP_002806-RA protein AED:0.38 eAED:0.38 QI:0/-1/0/1/-1/1/1/0/366